MFTGAALHIDFYYPTGYQICWIVKENPAGYHNIWFLITIINKLFSVFVQDYCLHVQLLELHPVETVIGYYTETYAEFPLDYIITMNQHNIWQGLYLIFK